MSTTVDQLMVSLGLNSSQFTSGMKAAQDSMAKFEANAKNVGDKLISFSATAAIWGAGVATAAGVAAAAIAKAGIDIGASIEDMSQQLNLSAAQYRVLGDSAEEAGLSMQKVTRAVLGMNSSLAQATAEGGAAADAFYQAGLNLGELSRADTNERLNIIADAVKNATTQTEKMTIATQAFGAQGARMVNWLNQGREGLEGAAEGFNSVHGAVNDLSFAKLQDARNALGDINDVLDTMKMLFADALTPIILAARDGLEKFIATGGGLGGVKTHVEELSLTFVELGGDFVQGAAIIYNELGELVAQIGVGMYQIISVFTKAGLIVWDVMSRPFDLIEKLAYKVFANITNTIGGLIGTFAELADIAGMDSFAEKLHSAETAMEALGKSSDDASAAIEDLNTDTPGLDKLIEDGRMIAESFRNRADELEDSARKEGSWGKAAVAAIEAVKAAEESKLTTKLAADEAMRGSAERLAAESDAIRAKDLEGAKKFFDELVNMSTTAYDIMFNSEMASIAAREEARKNSLIAYEQSLNDEAAAIQARMDVENEIRSGSNEGKILAEADLNNRIAEIQAKQMEDDRANQTSSVALWESGWRGKVDVMQSFLGQMSTLMQSNNRKMFEIGKAAAISETVINTYKSATAAYSSLAGIPIVGPALGAAAAAAAVVAGIANVQKIQSTSFGAGGGGSASSYSSGGGQGQTGGAATQEAPVQNVSRNVNISLQGDKQYSTNQVRSLISAINDATDDNTTLRAQVA